MQSDMANGPLKNSARTTSCMLALGFLLAVPCHGFSATANKGMPYLNCIHLNLIIGSVFSLMVIALLCAITKCRHTTKSLREKEKLFRTVADFTYDWEFRTAPDGKLIYTSPACERITGYCASDFQKDHGLLEKIVHPEDYDLYKQSLCHEGSCVQPFRILAANSGIRWVEHLCCQMRDSNGDLLGRRSTIRDITDHKLAEEKLLLAQYAHRLIQQSRRHGHHGRYCHLRQPCDAGTFWLHLSPGNARQAVHILPETASRGSACYSGVKRPKGNGKASCSPKETRAPYLNWKFRPLLPGMPHRSLCR